MNQLLEKAEKARQASRFQDAQKLYERSLKDPSGKQEKAEILLGLADVERIQGYFPQAMKHYTQAKELFGSNDPFAAMDAQTGWALAARAMGRPLESLRELKKALSFYRKERDRQGEAFVHWALGGTLRIAGEMKQGLRELQIALRMFKSLRESEGISYVCCALGGIFRMLGRYSESGKYYREANRRMRQRNDTFGIAYSYCGLGNVQRMAERFEAALPFYRKAERLYGKIGDRVSYAYTLWSLGTTYKMLGRYRKALQDFTKADKLFQKTGDTRGRIYTLLGFAEVRWLAKRPNGIFPKYLWPAEKLAVKNNYAWEKIHVRSLLELIIFQKPEAPSFWKQFRKLATARTKSKKRVLKTYRKTGSKFYPKSLPVNWP